MILTARHGFRAKHTNATEPLDLPRQSRGAHSQLLQFIPQVFARMNRWHRHLTPPKW